MKIALYLLVVVLTAAVCFADDKPDAAGAEKPAVPVVEKKDKAVMIREAVQDPAVFAELIAGMEMSEAVNSFVEVLAGLEAEGLKVEIKAGRTALMTAHMFKKWSSQASVLADKLVQSVPPELLQPIVAAAAVVMGNQSQIVTKAFVNRAPEAYAQAIRNAGAHPETVLPQGLLVSIGLPVANTVPVTGRAPTALPLAPPLNVEGAGVAEVPVPDPVGPSTPPPVVPPEPPPVPPPVPPTYSGQ